MQKNEINATGVFAQILDRRFPGLGDEFQAARNTTAPKVPESLHLLRQKIDDIVRHSSLLQQGNQPKLPTLSPLVEQAMQICIEITARSEVLESLLIGKGLVTKGDIDAKAQEQQKLVQARLDNLGHFDDKQDS
jgi:hypothetical protein